MVNQTYLPIFPFATLPALLLKGRRLRTQSSRAKRRMPLRLPGVTRRAPFGAFAVILWAPNCASSLCGLQTLHDGALFLAGNVGAETHVMNDHIPWRVTIHGGRPNIVATHTIIRPKLFAA